MDMSPAVKMRRPPKEAVHREVRHRYYAGLPGDRATSAANFIAYGASSTPTLVLIDRAVLCATITPAPCPRLN
jgi:hypothetical protein